MKSRMFSFTRTILLLICMFTLLTGNQCLAGRVLWDISHGVYLDYQPSGRYSSLVGDLETASFTVDTTTTGFLVDEPSDYDVIVIRGYCLPGEWYTSAEAEVIEQFVSNGGGLLILGDNISLAPWKYETVASKFGLSFAISEIDPYDTYTTSLDTHPVFDGISQIYMRAAGEIASTGGLAEVAWQEWTSNALAAAGTFGDGRVVALGDSNIFDNSYIGYVDNQPFAMNTFNYLVPEPTTLFLFAFGAMLAGRRRRKTRA